MTALHEDHPFHTNSSINVVFSTFRLDVLAGFQKHEFILLLGKQPTILCVSFHEACGVWFPGALVSIP